MEVKDNITSLDYAKNIWYVKDPDLWVEKDYKPYTVNSYMAGVVEALHIVQMLNEHPSVPKWNQYRLYMLAVPRRKRYVPWIGNKKVEKDLLKIMEIYKVNRVVAKGYYDVMSIQDRMNLHKPQNTGGVVR